VRCNVIFPEPYNLELTVNLLLPISLPTTARITDQALSFPPVTKFIQPQGSVLIASMDDPQPKPVRYLTRLLEELGLVSIYKSPLDVKLLCIQRFVRLFAYGGSTLILVAYLSALGHGEDRIGLFMTLTLVGDTIISFFLTLIADGLGRKAILALGALLMAASGVIFGLSGNYWVLLAAAIFGVISPRYNL